MILIAILIFTHFYVGYFLDLFNNKFISHTINCLLIGCIFYITLGVTDTVDNPMYIYFFYNDWNKIDPMFVIMRDIMLSFGYDYFDFYKLHIIIFTLSYYFLISRYTHNVFYVLMAFVVLYYVPYINQIRYYLAFPFYLLSVHYLIRSRNVFLSVLFGLLAFLSHSAIILMFAFVPMYYLFSNRMYFTVVFSSSGLMFLLMMILFQMGIAQQIDHFGEYFGKKAVSSFSGGMFNALPYFIYIGYLWYMDLRYRREYPNCDDDAYYSFLRKFSFFPIIFIPASFFVQVLGHRYVFPLFIIWMLFFLYLIRNKLELEKLYHFIVFAAVHLLAAFVFYILPLYLFNYSQYQEEFIRSIKSIKYINFYYFYNLLR